MHHIYIFKSWARWHMLIILELERQSRVPGAWRTASLDSWRVPGQRETLSHETASMSGLHTQAPANTRASTWIRTKEIENIKMSGQVASLDQQQKWQNQYCPKPQMKTKFENAVDGLADCSSSAASPLVYLLSLLCLLRAEFPACARTCLHSGNGRLCYKTFISSLLSNLIFL